MNMNKKDADQKKAFIDDTSSGYCMQAEGGSDQQERSRNIDGIYFKSQIKTPSDLTVVLR